jgi:chromosome partitioning protein
LSFFFFILFPREKLTKKPCGKTECYVSDKMEMERKVYCMASLISVCAQKGGVGKTMTAVSLGMGLARQGKKVLLLDADPQHSLTVSLGVKEPDKLDVTLATVMNSIIKGTDFDPQMGILHHSEHIDFMPANIALANTELELVSVIGREGILRQYVDMVALQYDYIITDTPPSLSLLTVNSLAASNSIIIPVTAKYLDAKGLELLLKTIAQIRRQVNPSLTISGILLTMVDRRSNFTKEIISLIRNAYGGSIRIFDEYIPNSVRAAESTAQGVSVFTHDPNGKVAAAYRSLVREVLDCA